MSFFKFNITKHYSNLDVQINVQCDEPFCPFQNTKLCKRNILKIILQKKGIVISESKLNKGEYQIQFYASKKQYTELKPFFKNIDEQIGMIQNPDAEKTAFSSHKSKSEPLPKQKKKVPQRRTFKNTEPIFNWIRKNYQAECRQSHIENQFFMVRNDKVIGFISLNKKNGLYSVNELNLVDADISI